MGFRCGIVGLPNVGKSTLFNALTETAAAQAANYPFCTIEPNVGNVAVPDPRQLGEPRIRHRHLTHIRLDGTERVIRRLRRRGLRQRVEERRFADIRQADDAAAKAHDLVL